MDVVRRDDFGRRSRDGLKVSPPFVSSCSLSRAPNLLADHPPFFFLSLDDELMEPVPSSSLLPPPPTSPLDPCLLLPALLKYASPSSALPSPPAESLPATPYASSTSSNKQLETPTTPSTGHSPLGVTLFSPSTPCFDFSSSCSNSSCSSVGSFDHLACDDVEEDEDPDAEGSSSRSLAELLQGSIFPSPPASTPKDRAFRRILDFQQPFFSDKDVEMGDDEGAEQRRSWARRRSGTL